MHQCAQARHPRAQVRDRRPDRPARLPDPGAQRRAGARPADGPGAPPADVGCDARAIQVSAPPPPTGHQPLTEDQVIAMLPESGRGLAIMRACVDDVTLSTGPGLSTVVSLQKRMAWRKDALLAQPPELSVPQQAEELTEGQLRNAG